MKIENPFESGHIKNYILAYVGVVVIMILFFIAAKIWNEPGHYPKKEFTDKEAVAGKETEAPKPKEKSEPKSKIKLLKGLYK